MISDDSQVLVGMTLVKNMEAFGVIWVAIMKSFQLVVGAGSGGLRIWWDVFGTLRLRFHPNRA